MDNSQKFGTVMSGWSVLYIEGSEVIFSQKFIFLLFKVDFIFANNTDPDEMPIMRHLIWVFTVCQKFPVYNGLSTRHFTLF